MDHFTVCDLWLFLGSACLAEGVLHPVDIVTFGEVISSVSTARFFSVFSSVHGHLSLDEEVLEFHGFNQIGVPDLTSVRDADVTIVLRNGMNSLTALLEVILSTEDSSVSGHRLLELKAELSGRVRSFRVTEFIELGNASLTSIGSQFRLGLSGSIFFGGGLRGAASKNN